MCNKSAAQRSAYKRNCLYVVNVGFCGGFSLALRRRAFYSADIRRGYARTLLLPITVGRQRLRVSIVTADCAQAIVPLERSATELDRYRLTHCLRTTLIITTALHVYT